MWRRRLGEEQVILNIYNCFQRPRHPNPDSCGLYRTVKRTKKGSDVSEDDLFERRAEALSRISHMIVTHKWSL